MHIVICGYLRSGTTMLYNMLRTSVDGFQFYEREYPALKFVGDPSDKITKRPFDSAKASRIKQEIPDARFIVCIRDPRDVLCSKHWLIDAFNVSWDRSIHTVEGNKVVWSSTGLIQMDKWLDRVPCATFIRYEDLVHNPDMIQAGLGALCGFKYKSAFTDFFLTQPPPQLTQQMKGLRPVETGRIGVWQDFPDRIISQFNQCPTLFDILEHRAYEQDREWFSDLWVQGTR